MTKKKLSKVQSSTLRLPGPGESSDQILRAVRGGGDLNVRNYATRNSVRSSMFIVSRRVVARELRQEFHVLATVELHFTPDGVSKPAALVTINIALLTEGGYCTLFGESLSREIWKDFDEGFDESNLNALVVSSTCPTQLVTQCVTNLLRTKARIPRVRSQFVTHCVTNPF